MTQANNSKREQRLVKALRDNLRRRKQAAREVAKFAGEAEGEVVRDRALEAQPEPDSRSRGEVPTRRV